MEVPVPSKATQRESQPILESIKSDVKIATLEAEIKHLKILLIGATTPSTVTKTSTPDTSSATNDRMSKLEKNMETMSQQFTSWMTEMRKTDNIGESKNSPASLAHKHFQAIAPPQGNQKNDRPAETSPTRHQSKRTDTCTTPQRLDPMNIETTQPSDQTNTGNDDMHIELFPANARTSASTTRLLLTQPPLPSTPPRLHDAAKLPPLPTHPPSPTNMAFLLAELDKAEHSYPEGYDTDNPMYVYQDNGGGCLFCVGLAQPTDFSPDGTIRGPQPTEDQSKTLSHLFYGPPPRITDPSIDPIPRSHSPADTIATLDETEATSTTSSPKGHPSPTPQE
jgi:hypothetical protein